MITISFNSLGLILNIIGALFMFFFGIPKILDKDGAGYLIRGHDEKQAKKAKRFTILSYLGIIILIGGFILQLIDSIK